MRRPPWKAKRWNRRSRTTGTSSHPRRKAAVGCAAGSTPVAQRVYEQGKRRRGLAAARVVEVVSRIRLAPVLKHPRQVSFGNMRPRHVLRDVSEAEAGQCRIEHRARGVQDELAFDAHPQVATAFFELPAVQAAMSR